MVLKFSCDQEYCVEIEGIEHFQSVNTVFFVIT